MEQQQPVLKDRYAERLRMKDAKRTTTQKIVKSINKVFSGIKRWWYNEEEHVYVTKFNNLKCAEDLPKVYGNIYNNHNKINIYGLWQFFSRTNAAKLKELTHRDNIYCVVNTQRMFHFVKFMTKWKVVLIKDAIKEIRRCEKAEVLPPVYDIGLLLNPEVKIVANMKEYIIDLYMLCGDGVNDLYHTEAKNVVEDAYLKYPNNVLMRIVK